MSFRHACISPATADPLEYLPRAPASLIQREPASAPSTRSSPDTYPPSLSDTSPSLAWQLIPYDVPWGLDFVDYAAGTLPGPEGPCLFLCSPTPVEKRRAAQACKMCRRRHVKCSGDRPACVRCTQKGYECEYAVEPRRPTSPVPVYRKTAGKGAAYDYFPDLSDRPHLQASLFASLSVGMRSTKHKHEESSDAYSWASPFSETFVPGNYCEFPHTIYAPQQAAPFPAPDAPSAPASVVTATATGAIGGFRFKDALRPQGLSPSDAGNRAYTTYIDGVPICFTDPYADVAYSPDLAAPDLDDYAYTPDYSFATPVSKSSTLVHALHYPYDTDPAVHRQHSCVR